MHTVRFHAFPILVDRSESSLGEPASRGFGRALRKAFLVALTVLLASALSAAPSAAKKDDDELSRKERKALLEALPAQYKQWLDDVQWLISEEERDLFLQLEKDYLRDAFIDRFWDVRDPYPETGRNEFREDYMARLQTVRQTFGERFDDRARVLLTNGYPHQRIVVNCKPYLVPIEVWYYDGSENVGFEFLLLFYKKWGVADYRLWDAGVSLGELSGEGEQISASRIQSSCRMQEGDAVLAALRFISQQGPAGSMALLADIITPREPPPGQEWVATFNSYTTELPEGVAVFDAALDLAYPGRKQSRTILQGNVVVPKENVAPVTFAEGLAPTYNFLLTGEVLREGKLFDNFRYEYDFATADAGERLPLVFERYLRPGTYTLMVKVEDLGSGKFHRSEQEIEVPSVDHPPRTEPVDPETARILDEANRALRSGETTIQIPPLFGEWQTGLVRVDTVITGDVDRVQFSLDDRPILTKNKPPYDVELDLGDVPRPRVLRVEAFDEGGEILASDERMLNTGEHRFAVRLEEPRPNKRYMRSLRAEAQVVVPKGEVLERVEFFLNETKLSTLYQEPWVQTIVLPEEEPIAYVRAVAYTPDGASTEDLVFVNAPANFESMEVDFVELYTLVLDKEGHPVLDLSRGDFTVFEDGVRQDVVRFEQVRNLPIHAAIMLDVSASMEGRLAKAQEAAIHFFQQAITPKDRATTITFNDHPSLTVDFTNDVERLAAGLAGVNAERGTALYDSLIFALYYFNGINGQRAILLLSDGKDESSRFEFDDVLEYARRSGVSIYSIGLEIGRGEGDAKRKLRQLADETGGRAFFIDDVAELTGIYDTIQQELRSRFLLAYQSSNSDQSDVFRTIEVETLNRDWEAKTLRGYYP